MVGWAVSDRLYQELALEALRKALAIRRPGEGLTHHADRGSQYCSIAYQAELRKHGIRISMSGKGNCFDNAVVETFFKSLKSELVWRTVFQTRAEAKQAIGRYIDGVRHITWRWIPFPERRGLEEMTLGPTAYLAVKAKGDSSMPSKQTWSEDAYGRGLQGPRDRVRAALLEPQPPVMQMYIPRHSV